MSGALPPPPRPAPARRGRSRLLLALFLLAGLLLVLEVVVRLAGVVNVSSGIATPHQAAFNAADMFLSVDDPALSYTNRPGAAATIDGIEYRHDAHGWRVLPEAARAAPDGGKSAEAVVFLGDSTTYGLGLRAQDALPAQVAAVLGGAIRPLDLGVCGYGTAQEHALYASLRAAIGDARLVVLVFFPNDFARGTFRWDSGLRVMYVDPVPVPFALQGWLWRSALYRALVSRLSAQHSAAGDYDPANPANQPFAIAEVEALAAAVRADGRQLVVVHLPAMEQLDPYDFEQPVARLAEACARLGVPFVDLLPAFLAERDRQIAEYAARGGAPLSEALRRGFLAQYWIDNPRDHHLNAAANRVAAAALADALRPLLATH